MSGKICVITGATSGIGLETARLLAEKGERVIGIGRDRGRCAEACADIRSGLPGASASSISFETADLSRLAEIRAVAARISACVDHVDVLVNNAGTFSLCRRETADGVELQLGVNWLAGFALTGLLLPRLRAARGARVVTVSSGSHFSGRMRWRDLQLRRGYNGLKAYDQSKLATVLFTAELARRLGPGSPVSTCAVDPGLVHTRIGAKGSNALVGLVWRFRTRGAISPRAAAESVVFCALEDALAATSGSYWKECRVAESSPRSRDILDAARLWEIGETLSGVRYPPALLAHFLPALLAHSPA